jgi:hypothetical protein
VGVEPPEPPPLWDDEPWLQPIEDIRKTRPDPANNQDAIVIAFLVMVIPFDLDPPCGTRFGRSPRRGSRGGIVATTIKIVHHHGDGFVASIILCDNY